MNEKLINLIKSACLVDDTAAIQLIASHLVVNDASQFVNSIHEPNTVKILVSQFGENSRRFHMEHADFKCDVYVVNSVQYVFIHHKDRYETDAITIINQ